MAVAIGLRRDYSGDDLRALARRSKDGGHGYVQKNFPARLAEIAALEASGKPIEI